MSNSRMGLERLGHVGLGLGNKLLQLGNLAYFFEGADFFLLIPIDGQASGIITAVLESRQTWMSNTVSI